MTSLIQKTSWPSLVGYSIVHSSLLVQPRFSPFCHTTEANIHREMTKCRDAVRDQNWPLLRMLTQGVAAKAKRVAEVGRMAADQAHEPWKKKTITAAVTRLENGNHS